MYVEFAANIAPHLNKGGKYRCEIDDVVTYCTTYSTQESGAYERRISILINKDLDPNATINTYKVSIIGVAMPDVIGNYKKIFVALSPTG